MITDQTEGFKDTAFNNRILKMEFLAIDHMIVGPSTINAWLNGDHVVWHNGMKHIQAPTSLLCANIHEVPVLFEDTGELADTKRYYSVLHEYQEKFPIFGPWYVQPELTIMNPTRFGFSDFARSHRLFLWSQQGGMQHEQHISTLSQPLWPPGSIEAMVEAFDVSMIGDPTGKLSPKGQDISRWDKLLSKLAASTTDEIYPPADVYCDLPAGIDLTTVEILTFFPGYMKDTFFLYRCMSVGWTAGSMAHAHVSHYNASLAADAGKLAGRLLQNFIQNLSFLLQRSPHMYSITAHKRVPVHRRPKLNDYTSTAFAIMFASMHGWVRDDKSIKDLRLSDLAVHAELLPKDADAGTFTALIQAQKEGRIENLRMSQIQGFVRTQSGWKVDHGATQDENCASHWIKFAEGENKRKRLKKSEMISAD